jgi:CubicO group peptidase (beta-lactamase class C family)
MSLTARAGEPTAKLDALMKSKLDRGNVPGAQVAVIKGNKIVALRSYGLANLETRTPVDDQTAFSIASITKAFIGVATMQLVEQDKLSLDAPLKRYLSGLPAAWQLITIRQLLNHVSGLPDLWGNYDVIAQAEAEAFAKAKAMPMAFETGARFQYTQTNYVLLGEIITSQSGMPFQQFVKLNQFDRLKLDHTLFAYSSTEPPNSAGRYTYLRIDKAGARKGDTLINRREEQPGWFMTCNGLMSTASDLARWIIALQGRRLLQKEGDLATLWAPGVLRNGQPSEGFGGIWNGYALGFELVRRAEHRAIASRGGERSAFYIYPDDDLAVVVLTNEMQSYPENWIDEIAALYL